MYGVERFTAVLNPPQAGILAVGAIEERAVVEDGELVAQPRMEITLTVRPPLRGRRDRVRVPAHRQVVPGGARVGPLI